MDWVAEEDQVTGDQVVEGDGLAELGLVA